MTTSAGEKMAPVLRGIVENHGAQDPPYDTNTCIRGLRVWNIILKAGLLQPFVIGVL